jgi:hypothetical protein
VNVTREHDGLILFIAACVAALVWWSALAQGMEPAKTAHNASQAPSSACQEATDGSRDAESLEQRLARLELQLRLSRAERVVNRKKR